MFQIPDFKELQRLVDGAGEAEVRRADPRARGGALRPPWPLGNEERAAAGRTGCLARGGRSSLSQADIAVASPRILRSSLLRLLARPLRMSAFS